MALDQYTIGDDVATDEVLDRLGRDGLVIIRGGTPEAVLATFRETAEVFGHRHSSMTDLITTLAPRPEATMTSGLAGFTHDHMQPHTDVTGQIAPPELIGLACVQSAAVGGAALLVDGAAVIADMMIDRPDVVAGLMRPGSVRFDNAEERSAVLTVDEFSGMVKLRYRDDGLADYSEVLAEFEVLRVTSSDTPNS